ncbi:MAG: ABC transporter permease [Bacteroidales bacterium]
MLKNYFVTAFRYFVRNKTFTTINLLGLSVGLACVILIAAWVSFELSYNSFHHNSSRIYRLSSKLYMSGAETRYPTQHAPVGSLVADAFPEVEQMTRIGRPHSRMFKHNENLLLVENIVFVDSSFFDIFTFDLPEGNGTTALTKPNSIVLTRKVAEQFFGGENALGKLLESDGEVYTVTGVLEDLPLNSSIQFSALEPMATPTSQRGEFSWGHGMGFETWLLLESGTDPYTLENKITKLMDDTVNELFKSINARIYGFLEPLNNIYLNSQVERQTIKGDRKTIAILIASALIILLIACFNFINLSTAQALRRVKEIGIRKVFGAFRKQLITQHIGESMLLVVFAMFLALVFAEVASPLLTHFSGKTVNVFSHNLRAIITIIPIIIFIVGIGAGWYPALFLSRFNPTLVFKQAGLSSHGQAGFRNVLSFFQFTILQLLTICTLIVFLQLQHIKTKELGFNPDNLLITRINTPNLEGKLEVLKQKLLEKPSIQSVSGHSFILGHTILARDFVLEGTTEAQNIAYMTVDESFFDTYQIELNQGRVFQYPVENEGGYVVVNEAFVKNHGYDNPIGRKIFLPNDPTHKENTIIGVVDNFNYSSLHRDIESIVFLTWHDPLNHLSVRLNPGDIPATLLDIRNVWEEVAGGEPFSYQFIDDKLSELYISDNRLGNILGVFTIMAIVIACAGLLGLTLFIAQSRQREIAVRRVLGASISRVIVISLGFTKWIILSALISWPLSWYLAQNWLNSFAYRIQIPLWPFIGATVFAILISVVITLTNILKVANQNPSTVLKYE